MHTKIGTELLYTAKFRNKMRLLSARSFIDAESGIRNFGREYRVRCKTDFSARLVLEERSNIVFLHGRRADREE